MLLELIWIVGFRVKEATQGYFHDFHEIRREGGHGGKSWIAPPVLIRQDVRPLRDWHAAGLSADGTFICSLQKALYFPNIQGTSMASRKTTHTTDLFKGRVSVVAVLTARVSEVSRCSKPGFILRDDLLRNIIQEHANSFVADVLEDWEQDPMFRYVQVCVPLTHESSIALTLETRFAR